MPKRIAVHVQGGPNAATTTNQPPPVGMAQPFVQSSDSRLPGYNRAPTFNELSERIFGSNPMQLDAVAYGVQSLTVTVNNNPQNTFAFGAATGGNHLPGDYELSEQFGDWQDWKAFWAEPQQGEGAYPLTVTGTDPNDLQTTVSFTIYRDFSVPSFSNVVPFLPGYSNTNPYFSFIVHDALPCDPSQALPGASPWCVASVSYTYDDLSALSNPLDARWHLIQGLYYDQSGNLQGSSVALDGTGQSATMSGNLGSDWNNLLDGPVNISFGVFDCGGQFASVVLSTVKDTTVPQISVIQPQDGNLFGVTPPDYNIYVQGGVLTDLEYSIGTSGAWTPIPLSDGAPAKVGSPPQDVLEFNGTIPATVWQNLPDGAEIDNLPFKFQAHDVVGREADGGVLINRDLLAPRLTVSEPAAGEAATSQAPMYSISVADLHLKDVYYMVYNSSVKYFLQNGSYEGNIDQGAWDLALNHTVTISFFAEDWAGNVAEVDTWVTRTDYVGPEQDTSVGFQNFFSATLEVWVILAGVGLVTVLVSIVAHRSVNSRLPKAGSGAKSSSVGGKIR